MNDSGSPDHPFPARRRWMAMLARAKADGIATLLGKCGSLPQYTTLRGPEGGLVMVRGRMGGGGHKFNLGEMTVTRCTVRTDTGFVGHAYVAGRDERRAELAALVDALMQDSERAGEIEMNVIAPLEEQQTERQMARAAKAAATRVQFFAMQTMRT